MKVRRPEFKRARAYRRRAAKRKPLVRQLKKLYREMAAAIRFSVPEMSWFRDFPSSASATTPITQLEDPASSTSQCAVSVNYDGAARGPFS